MNGQHGLPEGRIPLILAFNLSLLAFALGCSSQAQAPKTRDTPSVPVVVVPAVQKTVPVEIRAIGNVEAFSTVSVKSQVEGIVERAHFMEGQDVQEGDLLFTVDSRPFETALHQAEANLARDAAVEKNAKAQADRYTKLFEAGIVSQEQYDQFQTSAESYEAAVRADKAAIEKAKLDLSYCTIRSPIAGRTGSHIVHEGNLVKANADTPLVVINQISPIYVNFSVPEGYLSDIRRYWARGELRVQAIVPNVNRPPEGLLTFLDNTVDTTTGTVKLKAKFDNLDRQLWPGQFGNVVLRLTTQPNAIVVPSQAVQTGQSGQYVFVIKPDMTAESRPIIVGRSLDGETVVDQGLQPDERVVIDGQLRLAPGMKVAIKAPGAGVQEKRS
ncbi:MAG: efflux RND transporter periplasmic adaptor subunit [Acidobacteriia bacterium]|nr:efflux RND transporter periplasmic adaptor subunit [Terriglobia bacterium]